MGRGKIEIKRIENSTNRQVTFSKRRNGLIKKAKELSILCDAQLGLIVFSPTGKLSEFHSEQYSMRQIIERYRKVKGNNSIHDQEYENQQIYCEMTKMKSETEKLHLNMRHFAGEDLSSLPYNDLNQLEHQLEISVSKVRARKMQLMQQQLDNLKRKVAEQQAAFEHHQAVIEHSNKQAAVVSVEQPMLETGFGLYNPADHEQAAKNVLQLAPLSPQIAASYRLQPSANPQDSGCGFQRHGLQLWYSSSPPPLPL
ncbi:hypothetical protein Scep_013415 [Stephania cephalantha]|uniref:MADS-box transcription factor n=1 Tax=Stephania cephalantha TaxID=152367 RepID=A0AAP0JHC4_9MAGN